LRKRQLIALLFAVAAVAARLPFLLSGKIAFDSDEAVEGLMARHVLHGEFPAFFWGQAFKGVPEVYAAAGVFAVAGPSVMALKSVTLAFFAAYVAVNFVLLDAIADRWLAVAASLLLIAAPPALVFWSLDASAEYILLMLLGTVFLLLCARLEARRAEGEGQREEWLLAAIAFVIGVALWVQQLFVFYLVPAAVVFVFASQQWKRRELGRHSAPAIVLGAVAAVYLALGIIAFLTGGFSFQLGSMAFGVRAPQKMLRIGAAIAGLAAAWHLIANTSSVVFRRFASRAWPFAAGLLTGYSPVLLSSILVEPAHAPVRNANLRQLLGASPDIFGNVVPILSGFKIATTERLPIPLVAVVPGVAALAAYVWSNRRRLGGFVRLHPATSTVAGDFFPLFVVFAPLLFLVGGAYLDTQSYRYLIPLYAGLCVAWAGGSLWLARRNRVIASLLVSAILAIHAWQQTVWYRKLAPDTRSVATIDCLHRGGIRGGYADYWTSYKLTFLSNEDIIIAPTDGVDRYPAYTEFVRALPPTARVDDATHCN
jgi:4-amino-4-deoxy-L-arabinose transferase-like glycosyltransferase